MGTVAHTSLKLLNETGAKLLILVPGAGLEPARPLPGPRDFKSRVSTNSTIRAENGNRGLGIGKFTSGAAAESSCCHVEADVVGAVREPPLQLSGLEDCVPQLNKQWRQHQRNRAEQFDQYVQAGPGGIFEGIADSI